ncbi:MAG: hypothetical protein ACREIT_02150 [Tepidisphaeraceae bacterium]
MNNKPHSGHRHCVLPSPTEEVLAILPGAKPGTALRVSVEPGQDGYVRLEHLAYSAGMGWYAQKSFVVPGDVLQALVPELRKAGCLIPRRPARADEDAPVLRIGPAIEGDRPNHLRRRDA